MPDALRHVTIHYGSPTESGNGSAVDLSLPAALTVGELLPWIVDAVGAHDGTSREWRLAHPGGRGLDESATVAQNDIRDGDLLVLDTVSERPRVTRPVIAALSTGSPDDGIPAPLRVTGCLWACSLGIVALVGAGQDTHGLARITTAAVVAATVVAVTIAARGLGLDSTMVATLHVVAVALAAILGFLVVPAGPAPANFFLAAVAAGSLSAVLIRVSDRGTEILLAVLTAAGLSAVATGYAVLWPLDTPALGAVVSTLGVGMLPLTPRMSIALAGLTPPVPNTDADAPGDTTCDAEANVEGGQRNLVGLVLGASATAALGAVLLALSALPRVTPVDVAFATAVGMALLLRSRSYVSGRCHRAAMISGFCSLTAAFLLVVASAPGHGSWIGMIAVGTGVAICRPVTIRSPVTARIADALEYGALAAVVPLACWIAGVFDLLGALGLP